MAIDQYATARQIVKSLQQGQESGLTSSRRPDQTDLLTGVDGQSELVEDLPVLGIFEAYPLEDDPRPALRRKSGCLRMIRPIQVIRGSFRILKVTPTL